MHIKIMAAAAALCLAAVLLSPAAANAATPDPRTIAGAIEIADRYAPTPCAGQWDVTYDPTLPVRVHGGEATGLAVDTFGWRIVRCAFTISPTLDPAARCWVIWHEVTHFADGPEHVGRLAYDAPGPAECRAAAATASAVTSGHVSPRRLVMARVREALPAPRASWRISCGPTARRVRCRASSRRAAQGRVYVANRQADGDWRARRVQAGTSGS